MVNFLDRYKVPKLNQDQIHHLNISITPKSIEAVTENLATKNKHRTRWFMVQNSIIPSKKNSH